MSPVGVGASRFASALETGTAKLWVLLIGVNQYQDPTFPALKYAAIDCQGISNALAAATDPFPHKEFLIHNDLVEQTPSLSRVQFSLQRLVAEAQVQDTILIYFSGHGVVEPIHQRLGYANEQQTVLCLYDTDRERLLETGLPIQVVLEMLRHCAAHSQLLWLDACHSGNMRSLEQSPKMRTGVEIDLHLRSEREGSTQLNPSTQLLASLRQAVRNRGFYALLSCDEGQQSWEFPDLGHGVFSYYLMQGLNGAAADAQGIIDADSLYRYVYRQTMQYIDRTNQQVRLANQVKRERGEMSCAPEYSHQTPKRIVSGVGEIILGVVSSTIAITPDRSALIVDGGAEDLSNELDTLSHVLTQEGKFTLDRFVPPEDDAARSLAAVEERIHTFLGETATNPQDRFSRGEAQPIATRLLYLRGQITNVSVVGGEPSPLENRPQSQSVGADAWLTIKNGVKLSRTWLGQKLHQSSHHQQIVIIDAPGADLMAEWVDALKLLSGNLCIIGCAAPIDDAELFIQVLIEALISAAPQIGVPVVSLFTRLQTTLEALGVPCYLSLSGTQELIEIVPASEIELVELPPEIVIQTELSLPSTNLEFSSPDLTFGQDYTYLQPAQEITTTCSHPISPREGSANEHGLESILAKLVGPIAPTLIKRAQGENSAATIENLRMMLPNQFRDIFKQQVQLLLVQPVVSAPANIQQQVLEPIVVVGGEPSPLENRSFHVASGRGIAIQQPSEVDESLLHTYEQELNLAIGPIASYIITRTRKAHPHMSAPELIAALASNITDVDRANLFRRKCREKS
jgi:uncharacterized caspase-like protein